MSERHLAKGPRLPFIQLKNNLKIKEKSLRILRTTGGQSEAGRTKMLSTGFACHRQWFVLLTEKKKDSLEEELNSWKPSKVE